MPNRLASESSPYLLQHQNNPVDWNPWGEEALSRSIEEDKPIFLSIGYSACHWCHVMEHESFEDEHIAQLLNDNFVSIKVDREERPDLDQIYMNAVMALQRGQGGWPLNVFLTPQREVFFGGTYWPPNSKFGRPGFDEVLHGVLDAFLNRRDQVNEQSQQITAWLNNKESRQTETRLDEQVLKSALESLHSNFDFENGGFGGAPKFPHSMDLAFLIQMSKSQVPNLPFDGQVMLDMVRTTLKKMAYGGIFDHLAGGFARYSVDDHWLVPHFEKMLYDNALLAQAYVDMYVATGDKFYSMMATKTLNYLLSDLKDEHGGFHSTEDADSEGEEGKFYVWSKNEVLEILGDEVGERFCRLYNVTEAGNFEGQNILNMRQSYQEFADSEGIGKQALRDQMRDARKSLLKVRNKRVRPGKDDKVLASWNGLAISALARASVALDNEEYTDEAAKAASFVMTRMTGDVSRLFHTWRNGVAKVDGFLDDYANMAVALLDLYAADFRSHWLCAALELVGCIDRHFENESGGGFYFTADDTEELIARTVSFQDSSVPSGNAMAVLAFLRLGRLLGKPELIEKAELIINASASLVQRSSLAAGQMLIALNESLSDFVQLVFISESTQDFTKLRNKLPGQATNLFCTTPDRYMPIEELKDLMVGKKQIDSQPTLYICRNFVCDNPVIGWEQIESALSDLAAAPNEKTLN